jgi:hypothetical protein
MASNTSYLLLAKCLNLPTNADPGNTVIDVFSQALQNAAAQTGTTIGSANIAQGIYDFAVQITVDVDEYVSLNPSGAGVPTPQQVALGMAAALAHSAGVATETLPIMPLTDPVVADVVHSCTTSLDNREACIGSTQRSNDPRTVQLTDYVDPAHVAAAPSAFTASNIAGDWRMLGNKRAGDCTFAAAGHSIELWAAPNSPEPPLTKSDVMLAYYDARNARVSGSTNGRLIPPAEGLTATAALNYWRQNGIGGHRIDAYASVKRDDRDWVKYAISTFTCVYVVLALPNAVVRNGMRADQADWDRMPAAGPDAVLNLSNSHCVISTGYDANGLTAITWGRPMKTSWDFHDAYCDEMYVALPPSLRSSLSGVNVDQWLADVGGAEGDPRPDSVY